MSRGPLPGSTVRGSVSGRPIMAALDLLGRRWALRVLWELREGPLPFRALQSACGDISASVLRDRLAELREAGIVEHCRGVGYALAPMGRSLTQALAPLLSWSEAWAESLDRPGAPSP